MDLFFCKRKLKNEGKQWVITTINDLKLKHKNNWISISAILFEMYSWVNYINKKYRIVWNETLHTVWDVIRSSC
jgi:hypothetical protein